MRNAFLILAGLLFVTNAFAFEIVGEGQWAVRVSNQRMANELARKFQRAVYHVSAGRNGWGGDLLEFTLRRDNGQFVRISCYINLVVQKAQVGSSQTSTGYLRASECSHSPEIVPSTFTVLEDNVLQLTEIPIRAD